MSCHGDNKEKHAQHQHSPLKHMLHMILCCGIPIIIIGLLPIIARVSPGSSAWLGRIAPFLCPIMMVAMMLSREKKGSCCDNKHENHENKELE